MDVFAVRFIKAALFYALIGVILGLYMIPDPRLKYALVFVHAHLMLFGFVGMLIFGVAYHILPRFRGKPLHSPRLANWHLWLANVGLLGMAILWVITAIWTSPASKAGLVSFAAVAFLSFVVFLYNIWMTIR
jgi:cytochrome c oxidase cbb3-type subunit 1